MGAKNIQNLRPQNTRTKEEQREIARMGGKASGIARAHAADLKKAMIAELARLKGKGEDEMSAAEAIARAQVVKAIKGDTAAARFAAELTGAMVQKIQVEDLQPVQLLDDGLEDK